MALTIRSPRQAHNTVQKQLAHLGVTFKGHTISFEWETRHPYMQINAMKPSSTNWSKHVEQAWKQSQRGRRGGYYSLVRAYRSLSARRHPYVFTNRESDTSLDDSATQRYLVVGMALPTDDPKDMQESQSAKRQVVGINDTAVKPTVIHEEDDLPMLVVVAIDDCANAAQIKTDRHDNWIGLIRAKCVQLADNTMDFEETHLDSSDLDRASASSDAESPVADPSSLVDTTPTPDLIPQADDDDAVPGGRASRSMEGLGGRRPSTQSELPIHADLLAFFEMDIEEAHFDLPQAEAFVAQFLAQWPHVAGVNAVRIMLIRRALLESKTMIPYEGMLVFIHVAVSSLRATSADDVDYHNFRESLHDIVKAAAQTCHVSFPQSPRPRIPITANDDVLPMLRSYRQIFRKALASCKAFNEHFEFLFELLGEDDDRPGTYDQALCRIADATDASTRKAAIMSLLQMMLLGDCHGPGVTQATLEDVINSIDEGLSVYDLSS